MRDKVLIVATTPYMIRQFLMSDIKLLKDIGYDVEIATNFNGFNILNDKILLDFKHELNDNHIKINQVDFTRSVINIKKMIKSLKQLKKLFELQEYKILHTHTPIASAVSRIIGKLYRKNGMKIIYTAHGFHFYKGAPLINWLFFYPIEKYLSKYTDVLITINNEDFNRANKKFYMRKLEYIPGVGIDVKRFQLNNFDKDKYRKKLGLNHNDFAILSVGELNKNKNHEVIIRAIAQLGIDNIHYYIAGQGNLQEYLINLSIKLGLQRQVHLLGYRDDIIELNNSIDVFAFPSKREGLGLAALEAMASSVPIITSNIHGIKDYSVNGLTGFCYSPNNYKGFSNGIKYLILNKEETKKIGRKNVEIVRKYDTSNVNDIMKNIYLKQGDIYKKI